MENNDIREKINGNEEFVVLDDDDLVVVAGGATETTEDTYTRGCPFCGQVATGPRARVEAWMAVHFKCCDKNPCK